MNQTTPVNITAFRAAILDLQNSSIPSSKAFDAARIFAREMSLMGTLIVDNLLHIADVETLSHTQLVILDQPMLFSRWKMVEAVDIAKKTYEITSKGKLVVKFLKDLKQAQAELMAA